MADLKLSISVWHSPFDAQRRQWLVSILRKLGGQEELARHSISWVVSGDTQRLGFWPSYRAALITSLRDSTATHHLILADDMLPCRDFPARAMAALHARPDAVVCYFSMRKSVREAWEQQIPWVRSPEGCWGGAFVMPTRMIQEFMQWERRTIDPAYKSSDRRMALYFMEQKIPVWQTVPCLLQHIGAAVSLGGNANSRRVTDRFADDVEARPDTFHVLETLRDGGTLSLKRESQRAYLHPPRLS